MRPFKDDFDHLLEGSLAFLRVLKQILGIIEVIVLVDGLFFGVSRMFASFLRW